MELQDVQNNKEWIGPIRCPVCHKRKFYINFEKRAYNCFHIGKYHKEFKGVGITQLPEKFGLTTLTQLKIHIKGLCAHIPDRKPCSEIKSKLTVRSAFENSALRNLALIKTAFDFCNRKWIDMQYWDQLFLDFDSYNNFRIFVPVYDYADDVVYKNHNLPLYSGYQARILNGKSDVKDLTPGIRNTEIVYNLENILGDTVIICESVFDTFINRSKIVSVFGHHLGEKQLKILREKFQQFIFCFDGDAEEDAKKYAKLIVGEKNDFNKSWWLKLGEYYDDNGLLKDRQLDDVKYDLYNQTVYQCNSDIEMRLGDLL